MGFMFVFVTIHGEKKFIKLYRTSSVVEDPTISLIKVKIVLVVHCLDLFYEKCLLRRVKV